MIRARDTDADIFKRSIGCLGHFMGQAPVEIRVRRRSGVECSCGAAPGVGAGARSGARIVMGLVRRIGDGSPGFHLRQS